MTVIPVWASPPDVVGRVVAGQENKIGVELSRRLQHEMEERRTGVAVVVAVIARGDILSGRGSIRRTTAEGQAAV